MHRFPSKFKNKKRTKTERSLKIATSQFTSALSSQFNLERRQCFQRKKPAARARVVGVGGSPLKRILVKLHLLLVRGSRHRRRMVVQKEKGARAYVLRSWKKKRRYSIFFSIGLTITKPNHSKFELQCHSQIGCLIVLFCQLVSSGFCNKVFTVIRLIPTIFVLHIFKKIIQNGLVPQKIEEKDKDMKTRKSSSGLVPSFNRLRIQQCYKMAK